MSINVRLGSCCLRAWRCAVTDHLWCFSALEGQSYDTLTVIIRCPQGHETMWAFRDVRPCRQSSKQNEQYGFCEQLAAVLSSCFCCERKNPFLHIYRFHFTHRINQVDFIFHVILCKDLLLVFMLALLEVLSVHEDNQNWTANNLFPLRCLL